MAGSVDNNSNISSLLRAQQAQQVQSAAAKPKPITITQTASARTPVVAKSFDVAQAAKSQSSNANVPRGSIVDVTV